MHTPELRSNPFALMMNPAEVIQAMERSERLERLQRRICRPLDKPLIAKVLEGSNDYDSAIDAESDS